jgi:hypothetical protein
MCLRKVDPKVPSKGFVPRIVWKMFDENPNSAPGVVRGYYRSTIHTFGKPMLCRKRRILGYGPDSYPTGFHGYATKDAIWHSSRCYYPCLLEKIHTRGTEMADGHPRSVYVGKKLTVYRTIEEAQAALKNLRAAKRKKKPA